VNKTIEAETKLWRALIDSMIHDLGSSNGELRGDAEDWLCPLNEDFLFVCDLADLDPNEILNQINNYKEVLQSSDNLNTKIKRIKRIKRRNDNGERTPTNRLYT
jgi:hypothetical protein